MTTPKERKKVLITGGTGSVGQALVEAFAASRASVWFQYCNDTTTAKKLHADFGAKPMQMDFTKPVVLPMTDFDVLVNNAGINISDVLAHEVTNEAWEKTLKVNLTAPFQLLKQCLPSMVRNRWGRVVNISSIYGLRAVEGNFPYTVSKHGLCGLTKTIAKEYAPHGITCNEICPGPIDSDMMREIGSKAVANTPRTLKAYLDEVCEEVPAKRMAKPEEIAAIAVFLASQEAAYINGASIPVDGALIA